MQPNQPVPKDPHKIPFLSPRLRGARFDDATVPVEVFAEFAAYRELVVAVAKEIFRERHPQRQRVPKGFAESFQLSIKEVEDGSAIPVLLRNVVAVLALFGEHDQDEFDEARDRISQAVEDVNSGKGLPQGFPRHALRYFGTFGRTLNADETMELVRPGEDAGVRYGQALRKKLLRLSTTTYVEDVALLGRITEVDYRNRTFQIDTDGESSRRIQGAYPEEMNDEINRVAGASLLVQVVGAAEHNADGRVERIYSVDELWTGDAVHVRDRMDELLQLEAGWLDGEGNALDRLHAERVRDVLVAVVSVGDITSPRIFPTPDGSVEAEWTVGTWEVAVTFGLTGSVEVSAVNLTTGADADHELAFETLAETDGSALVDLLAQWRGGRDGNA